MNRHVLKHWLILGALGASLMSGCSQLSYGPETAMIVGPSGGNVAYGNSSATAPYWSYGPPSSGATPRPPAAPSTAALQGPARQQTLSPSTPVVDSGVVILANGQQSGEPPVVTASTLGAPPMARIEFQSPVIRDQASLMAPQPLTSTPATAPSLATVTGMSFPRAAPAPLRKSFVDVTAAPCFSHAPDYSWIVGQVEYSRIAKNWRLRYASVDEADKHGGRMLLIENHHLSLLQDGQYVRVHGHVVNPDNPDSGPVFYRIESFDTVENCNATDPQTVPQ
jgi:hypothetical protein